MPEQEAGAPDYYGAMVFLAVLVYPDNVKQRNDFVRKAKALHYRDYVDQGGNPDQVPEAFRDIVFNRPDRDLYQGGRIHMAWDIIVTRRLAAAELGFLVLTENVRSSCSSMESLCEVVTAIIGASRFQAAAMARIWGESKPVLHLAIALHNVLDETKGEVSAHELLRHPAWAGKAIKNPTNMLALLAHLRGLGISAASAIQIVYPAP